MEANDLFKKVRTIEIKTRRLSRHIFAGEYHSAFKGKGIVFSEVRDYQYGDDIRSIDWNVTARFNHQYVKIFEEDRELTVMLLVDVSGSREFGTSTQMKKNLVTELGAVLSFSAIQNNDKIGVIFFSDKVEKFIPPKKGKKHALRIIRELIEYEPVSKKTNITEALRYLDNTIKKRCISFVISDFLDVDEQKKINFENAFRIANKKHELIALKIYDKRESEIPSIGLIKLKDAETGEEVWFDSSDKGARIRYATWWKEVNKNLQDFLSRNGIDYVYLETGKDYVLPLMNLFKKR
ncbi:MAG: DUF58 domain-containing protein [Bacteroidota bacterium]